MNINRIKKTLRRFRKDFKSWVGMACFVTIIWMPFFLIASKCGADPTGRHRLRSREVHETLEESRRQIEEIKRDAAMRRMPEMHEPPRDVEHERWMRRLLEDARAQQAGGGTDDGLGTSDDGGSGSPDTEPGTPGEPEK